MDITSIDSTIENSNSQFLTLEEAAEILKVNPTTIGRRVKNGEIAAIHIGRSVRIRRQDLDKYIKDLLDI